MPRTIAFLRAINVGGHVVRMEVLREIVSGLGLTKVETFIASGNVIFEGPAEPEAALTARIEAGLFQALGYEVATFLRSATEVAAVAACEPFAAVERAAAQAFVVGFLARPLAGHELAALGALRTQIDDFQCVGREVYWLCRRKQSESSFSSAVFERRVKVRATFRGVSTVRKLAAKYPPG